MMPAIKRGVFTMQRSIRRILGTVLAAAMLTSAAGSLPQTALTASAANPDYVEALQKSLYFYECQQAGNLPDWNRVE